MHAICIQNLFYSECLIISSTALKCSAIIYVQYTTLIKFVEFKNRPQVSVFFFFFFLFAKNLALTPEMCGSRDMHYENMPMQYTVIFVSFKNGKFY